MVEFKIFPTNSKTKKMIFQLKNIEKNAYYLWHTSIRKLSLLFPFLFFLINFRIWKANKSIFWTNSFTETNFPSDLYISKSMQYNFD